MKRKLLLSFVAAMCAFALHAQPPGWQYSQEIVATNPNGNALYGYQLPIIVNTQQLIQQGKLRSDGSDLRFGTPCTGTKNFGYYIDSGINTTQTLIYVKIDTMLAQSTSSFYMYYGNPNAVAGSTINIFDGPYTTTNQTPPDPSYQYSYNAYGYEMGMYFSVNNPIFVKSLGKYVPIAGSLPVGIYDNETATLLASTTVAGTSNSYHYNNLPSLVKLEPGKTYSAVGLFVTNTSYYDYYGSLPSSNPAINILGPAYNYGASSLSTAVPYYYQSNDIRGYVDMEFYTTVSATIQPTYAFGATNGPGFVMQTPSSFSICPNGSGTLSTQAAGNNPTYVWQVNTGSGWTNLSNNSNYSGVHTGTLSLLNVPASMSGYQYRANVTSSCGSGYTNVSTLHVPTSYTLPLATIYGPNPACEFVNSYYTVLTNITNPGYQWYLNGSMVSTDSFYAFQPTSGDQLYCLLTAPAGSTGCYTTPQAVTNELTITTGSNLVPYDSVAANNNNVCAATQVNFRAYTDVTLGSYQWKVNNVNVGTNSPNYAYVPAAGDQVTCVVTTPTNGCYSVNTATSAPVVMSVIQNVGSTISIWADQNYNPGTVVTLNASVLNAGNDYKIAWLLNNQPADTVSNQTIYQFVKNAGTDRINAVLIPVSSPETGTCYGPSASNVLNIGSATGVNTINANNKIQAYPNPFNEDLTVSGLVNGDRVCIFDIVGRRVSEVWNATGSDKQTFSIKGLTPGTYFLRINSATGEMKATVSLQKQ